MKKNKGFAPIVIALVIVAVLAAGSAIYYVGKNSNTLPKEENNFSQEKQNKLNDTNIKNIVPGTTSQNTEIKTKETEEKSIDTSSSSSPALIGGGCTYNEIKGQCKINSISKTKDSISQAQIEGGAGYEGFEVKFDFVPPVGLNNISGFDIKSVIGKDFLLQLANSWYPGIKYLEKYNIKEGAKFDCKLKVKTKGTCTPLIFDFDKINQTDYFEK